MDILTSSEKEVNLVLIDPKTITKGPAVLAVTLPDGNTLQIKCLKGQVLRNVLLDSKIDVYDLKGKLSNCGGGGLCGTCVVGLDIPGYCL
jgi:ferredoxin